MSSFTFFSHPLLDVAISPVEILLYTFPLWLLAAAGIVVTTLIVLAVVLVYRAKSRKKENERSQKP